MPFTSWRLIVTQPLSGVENMAIDEALLRSFVPGTSSPILRLYAWKPCSISLGRFQKAAKVLDLAQCRCDNLSVVRRISGGGAIYHNEELTYSLVCSPYHIPASASVRESFRVLTGFLLMFYRSHGINAAFAVDIAEKGTRLGERTAFCLAGRENFDIVANGCKIGGNAQRRLRGVIFQHGSIPLQNHAATGLRYMRDRQPEYAAGTVSLAEYGVSRSRSSLEADLAATFSHTLGVTLKQSSFTDEEIREIDFLLEKYRSDCWNLEGSDDKHASHM